MQNSEDSSSYLQKRPFSPLQDERPAKSSNSPSQRETNTGVAVQYHLENPRPSAAESSSDGFSSELFPSDDSDGESKGIKNSLSKYNPGLWGASKKVLEQNVRSRSNIPGDQPEPERPSSDGYQSDTSDPNTDSSSDIPCAQPMPEGSLGLSDDENRSDSSIASPGSDDIPVNAVKSNIYVGYNVSKDYIISFSISTERPDTGLPDKQQGDHVTSYIVILEAILSSTNSHTLNNAISKVRALLEKFNQSPAVKHFLCEFGLQVTPLYRNGLRQQIIKHLENNPGLLEEEDRKAANNALKYAKVSHLAKSLADLTTYMLQMLQQDPLSRVFSWGRVNKAANEGLRARDSAYALTVLDCFCEIEALSARQVLDSSELEARLTELVKGLGAKDRGRNWNDHIMRLGLSNLVGMTEVKNLLKTLDSGLTADKKVQLLIDCKNKILNNASGVAERIGNLYDYQRVLEFSLEQANRNKTGNKLSLNKYIEKLQKVFSSSRHQIKPEDESKILIERTNVTSLYETLIRHFYAIETAFPNLCQQHEYDSIKKCFLEQEILEKSNWKEFKLPGDQCLTRENIEGNISPSNPEKRVSFLSNS